jgi:flagellar basal body-associated protein FliL
MKLSIIAIIIIIIAGIAGYLIFSTPPQETPEELSIEGIDRLLNYLETMEDIESEMDLEELDEIDLNLDL